ncbi:MAG: zinc ribbon domain-containing protein [Deltaproteobacteria bacterium]|nr:MAG: zinc ribbon domain-containing protein [Deltaproteobacteria bacterium]
MPIFEFVCKKCNHRFEELFLGSENRKSVCPNCHSRSVEKLMSAGAIRPNGIPTGAGGFSPPPCKPAASGG